MRYGDAVKKYFGEKGQAVHFPKKGSKEYEEIRAIMSQSGAAAAAAGDATGSSAVSAAAAPLEKKVRKSRPKKEKAAPAPGASQDSPTKAGGHTTLIDAPHVTAQAVAAVVEDTEKKPRKKRAPKAIQRDGLPPTEDLLRANAVENGSMHITPAAYPGVVEQIKKVLEVKPEGVPTRSEVKTKPEIMTSKTTEGKRTDDPKAISGRAPFSFSAVRHLLRQ